MQIFFSFIPTCFCFCPHCLTIKLNIRYFENGLFAFVSISQFYTEVTEVETWIREKLPRVSSEDYGRDETSAQSLLRKHETFDLEMDSYRTKIKDLRKTCQELVSAKHFDAERIQKRQVMLQALLSRNLFDV